MHYIVAMKTKSIGTIGNYYGNLEVAQKDGLFYWGIDNWNGTRWEEIPQVLYDQLVAYEDERIKKSRKFVDRV